MDANDKSGKEYTSIDIVDGSKKCKKCIFRVPNVLRRQKPEAYSPDVVSIGPFHDREQKNKEEAKAIKAGKKAGKKGGISEKDYQFMERVKQSYLDEILTGMEIKTLEDLIPKVTEHSRQAYRQKKKKQDEGQDDKNFKSYCNSCSFDERARSFYAEPLDDIAQEDFIKMMVVDGCFLVQLFRKWYNFELRDFDDLVFNMDCMLHCLCHDILLLENQLPWFVLHSLYNLTHHLYHGEPSLSRLILNALRIVPSLQKSCDSYRCHCDADFLHILDLVRTSILPAKTAEPRASEEDRKDKKNSPTGNSGSSRSVHEPVLGADEHQICTATALSKAYIKFKADIPDRDPDKKSKSITDILFQKCGFVRRDTPDRDKKSKSIIDIQFKECKWLVRNGTLTIPQLNVGMSSETLFRNLIAAEQCYNDYSNEITSYAIFMDNLISSKEDLELLCKEKVIGNMMSEEDGCAFFSNLYKDIPHNKFHYVDLCERVNKRYKLKWYTWLATLKIEKFSNPWRVLAFILGFIILFLTAWSSVNNIRRKI